MMNRMSSFRWWIALIGLWTVVFSLIGFTGPGRIDCPDGQTRFEVGRSLVSHGDSVIRDRRVKWNTFPGRDDNRYTTYRLPQSVVAAGAIVLANATHEENESWQHFVFCLHGAVFAGFLAVMYAIWFRHRGLTDSASLFWAFAGIVATPSWFYATSCYDDLMSSVPVVTALILSAIARNKWPLWGAVGSGLLMGLAFHCKEPLAIFFLGAIALQDDPKRSLKQRFLLIGLHLLAMSLGVITKQLYHQFKFPPESIPLHEPILAGMLAPWPGNPLAGFCSLLFSPGTGIWWYCPPVIGCVIGLWLEKRTNARVFWAIVLASLILIGFLSTISFFKGDPAWGPRYLTPIYAVLWLFAPWGLGKLFVGFRYGLLLLGVFVQMMAISVDAHRLFIERKAPSSLTAELPWVYFSPVMNHLWHRPREFLEIYENEDPGMVFSPNPEPTFGFPIIDPLYRNIKEGKDLIRTFHILNCFRPWWNSYLFLEEHQRPVSIYGGMFFFIGLGLLGGMLITWADRPRK